MPQRLVIAAVIALACSACVGKELAADASAKAYIEYVELRQVSTTSPTDGPYDGERGYFLPYESIEHPTMRVRGGWINTGSAKVCPVESDYFCLLIGGELTIAIPRAPLELGVRWRFDDRLYEVMDEVLPDPYRSDIRPYDHIIRAEAVLSWRESCAWIFYSETEGVTGLIDGSCQPLSKLKLGDLSILRAPPLGHPPIPLRDADLARVPKGAFLTKEQETYLRTYPMTDEGWRVRNDCLASELCDVESANRELSNVEKFLNPDQFIGQWVEMCGYIHDRLDDGNIWLHKPRPNLVNSGLGFIAAREREEPSRYDGQEACVTGEIVRTGCGKEVDCAWSDFEFALKEEVVEQ